MTLLVMTPLDEEFTYLERSITSAGYLSKSVRVGPIRTTKFVDLGVTMAHGGHGKTQMGVQTRYLLDRLDGINSVVCAGAAGAISGSLAVGDVVAATLTIEHDYQLKFVTRPLPAFPGDSGLLKRLERVEHRDGFGLFFGFVASGDEDVIDLQRGADLAEATGAMAVAWEGAGAARACTFTDVPFLELRGITDTANHDAPADFETNLEVAMANIGTVLIELTSRNPTR
jgi:adenosylhomocysteine nucleosidase